MKNKKFKIKFWQFFEDDKGYFSLMRLQSFLVLILTFWVIIYQITQGYKYFDKIMANTTIKSLDDAKMVHDLFGNFVNVELVLMLLVAAFVPKALQKVVEMKYFNFGKSATKTEPENPTKPVVNPTDKPTTKPSDTNGDLSI
jgi:hypothetical protein